MRHVLLAGLITIVVLSLGQVALAQDSGVTTISVYRGWGTQRDTMAKGIELFEAAHPNIKVEIVDIPDSNYMDALKVQLLTGIGPDVFMIQAPDAASFIHAGLAKDLTSLFERDLNMNDYLAAFGSMTYGGRYYGVPASGGGYRIDAMFVNRDLLAAGGLTPPGPEISEALTFKEFLAIARKLTIDRSGDGMPEQYGTHFRTARWYHWLPSNGVTLFNEDYSDTLVDSPESIEVLSFLQQMLVYDQVSDPKNWGFVPQRTATQIMWRDRVFAIQKNSKGAFDWSVAPQPSGKAGSVGVSNMHPLSINATSDKVDAAWEFLKFTISEPYQRLCAEEGRAIVLKSVALAPEFVFSADPPYSLVPFLGGEAVDYVANMPPPGVEEPEVIGETLQKLWAGEIAPRTAAETMADAWRRALQDRPDK